LNFPKVPKNNSYYGPWTINYGPTTINHKPNPMLRRIACLAILSCLLFSCSNKKYDTIIRNGLVYDGNGGEPFKADIAIKNDTIAFIGDLSKESSAKNEVDAKGMAVTPGFINMLSWSPVTLIEDGNSQGEIREGVTLEVFGEGESMGPLNPKMKKEMQDDQSIFKYLVNWNTLGEYMHVAGEKRYQLQHRIFCGRHYYTHQCDRRRQPRSHAC
jgi:N-acyl-D-amino-acid deacylase